MSTQATASNVNYLNNGWTWKSWLFTVDHKRIAVLYLISISVFFLLGGIFAGLVRMELLTPQGDLMEADRHVKPGPDPFAPVNGAGFN